MRYRGLSLCQVWRFLAFWFLSCTHTHARARTQYANDRYTHASSTVGVSNSVHCVVCQCSADCKTVHQMRTVACRTYSGQFSTACSVGTRPPHIRECQGLCTNDSNANKSGKYINKQAVLHLLSTHFCISKVFVIEA